MGEVVLDASAILAVANKERGAERVEAVRADAIVSSVNYAEVLSHFAERGHNLSRLLGAFGWLDAALVAFDAEQAREAARLRPLTHHLRLSLADRACLALARLRRCPVMTADRAWRALRLGVEIRIIR
jgi:ribonuclease VapC